VATFCAAIFAGLTLMALTLSAEEGVLAGLVHTALLMPLVAAYGISIAFTVIPTVTPAASLVGAVLWELGGRASWVRRRRVWAAVGAIFALAVLAAMQFGIVPDLTGLLDEPVAASLAVSFLLAGCAAALLFRAGLKFLALFFLPEEAEAGEEA
jgi:hypothetical protein